MTEAGEVQASLDIKDNMLLEKETIQGAQCYETP